MANIDSPIPLSEIESVLAWVDTFKLSRPTRKINRDFSDAVLLAEILSVYYPKLVEMHNYPPRNSHSLKLNNWMTLNRKVLKKLKLNLCCNTMEQLANCAPGVIERVLVMVKEKIRRDEDAKNSLKETEQNLSSGGSYYEACGDEGNSRGETYPSNQVLAQGLAGRAKADDIGPGGHKFLNPYKKHVLVVPVKTRVNGVLETIQQKVVSYDVHCTLKEELKDARDAADVLKQKVEHLDNLLKLKEERIDELQNQLERKQSRRKEAENTPSNTSIPAEVLLMPDDLPVKLPASLSLKALDSKSRLEESRIPIAKDSMRTLSRPSISEVNSRDCVLRTDVSSKPDATERDTIKPVIEIPIAPKPDLPDVPKSETKLPHDEDGCMPEIAPFKSIPDAPKSIADVGKFQQSLTKINDAFNNYMPETPIIQQKSDRYIDLEEFKDSEELTVTIGDTIENELNNITRSIDLQDISNMA